MVIPKYDIGRTVFIYEKGKLVPQVISKIQVLITESEFKVGYQFYTEDNDIILRLLRFDLYKDESEVFKSLEEFVKINEQNNEA